MSKKKVKQFDLDNLIDLVKSLDAYDYYSGDGSNGTYHRLGEYCSKYEDSIINFLVEAMENKSKVLHLEQENDELKMSLVNAEDELKALNKTRKMIGD